MIVIADGDVGRNKVIKGKPLPLGVDLLTNEQFGNEQFLRNALDYLLDDSNLMELGETETLKKDFSTGKESLKRIDPAVDQFTASTGYYRSYRGLFFWLRKKKFDKI